MGGLRLARLPGTCKGMQEIMNVQVASWHKRLMGLLRLEPGLN